MRILLFFILLCFAPSAFAQISVKGSLVDETGTSVPFATVALLYPSDSTLAYFAISKENGDFTFQNVAPGDYLLQCSRMGHHTYWKNLTFPRAEGNDLGHLVMQQVETSLGEVEIVDEHIPFRMKGDTIEYNSAAYRVGPEDVVEDLLEQLPGVSVDEAGNIKAQGEDVQKVLVDGKEFFGNDPKVATRNLPADAVKKVEVYDDLSDEAELTGNYDGQHEKTINLLLDENAKSAWMGDVKGSYGTDDHFTADLKAYRFTKTAQIAALGMLNNINRFGFSFQDYIDFQGGFQNFMSGNGNIEMELGNENDAPIDFGQQVTGNVTSGGGGLNYSYEKKKDNRINISYMVNGADKNLNQEINTENTLEDSYYTSQQFTDEFSNNRNHLINIGWKAKIDSSGRINISANGSLNNTDRFTQSDQFTYNSLSLVNGLSRYESMNIDGIRGRVNGSILKKSKGIINLYKLNAMVSVDDNSRTSGWENSSTFYDDDLVLKENMKRQEPIVVKHGEVSTGITIPLSGSYSLQPYLETGIESSEVERTQNALNNDVQLIDSLSGSFGIDHSWLTPGLRLTKSVKRKSFSIGCNAEFVELDNYGGGGVNTERTFAFILPYLSWSREYRSGRTISADYNTSSRMPEVSEMMPLVDKNNPLQWFAGNPGLEPEYNHSGNLRWMIFDQFSFTSFFLTVRGMYTKNRISSSTTIGEDLVISVIPVNVPEAWRSTASCEFSTPIRKIGLNVSISAQEDWRHGQNFVNELPNYFSSLGHEASIKFENRKKDKFKASLQTGGKLTNARYDSGQQQKVDYFQYFVFAGLEYNPDKKWSMEASGRWTRYESAGFSGEINVPMVKARASWSGISGGRGTLGLEVFDILNQNTGVERWSELNYLQEVRSDIIQRYILFTFKYRINKVQRDSGWQVEVE